jgi:hypothetical protein
LPSREADAWASNVNVGGYTTAAEGSTGAVVVGYTRSLSERLWVCPFRGTASSAGNRVASIAPASGSVLAVGTLVNQLTGADVALARVQR